MKTLMKVSIACGLAVLVAVAGIPAAAAPDFDIAADYDAGSNPGAAGWAFCASGLGGAVIGTYGAYSGTDFNNEENGWRDAVSTHLGWCKIASKGDGYGGGAPANGFDIVDGDVITHSSTSVKWTADASSAGKYLIVIRAWMIRDAVGDENTFSLYKNDSTLLASSVLQNSYRRANPKTVASVVVNLQSGDYVRLLVDGTSGTEYSGVDFTLTGLDPDYDIAADYDAASNPGAAGWGYCLAGTGGALMTTYTNGGYSASDFGGQESGWVEDGAHHRGWCKIASADDGYGGAPADAFDVANGDIITHSSTSVKWTADASSAGKYLIDVRGWLIRDKGEGNENTFSLYRNDTDLLASAVVGVVDTRANPETVAEELSVTLANGDWVRLLVTGTVGTDYSGVHFTLRRVEEPDFDMSGDYDTVSNPGAEGWGFCAAGTGGAIIPTYGGYSTGDFGGEENGWRDAGSTHLGWCKIASAHDGYGANPADAFDLINGDVITHADTSVKWTASAATAGDYLVTVRGWQIRDFDRADSLKLYKNDTELLASGNVMDTNTRGLPQVVAYEFPVTLAAGDFLRVLAADVATYNRDYANIEFYLTEFQEQAVGSMLIVR